MTDERLERYHATRASTASTGSCTCWRASSCRRSSSSTSGSTATGREHARVKGGLIVAANHRSFLDPFVIGALLPWRRPMHYVAKVELFEKRWQGWLLSRLGAFPIRRGESDEDAMETARADRSSAAAPSASSPRAPGSAAAPWRARSAASAGSRSRPAPPVLPVAVHRHRARAPRLADPAAQGPAPRRQGDDLPARREPLAGARRNGHRRGSGPTSSCSGSSSAACRRCAAPR